MNTPFLQVFTAKISNYLGERVHPQARHEEIAAATNEKVRAEKYSVWKLLQYAVEKTFARPFTDFSFTKKENGKWFCEDFYFSLSHSNNLVAVALSSAPVGVDIQKNQPLKSLDIAKKILTNAEMQVFQNLPENEMNAYLVWVWTKKEAAFKRGNEKIFTPTKIHLTPVENLISTLLDGEEYFLAVSSTQLPSLCYQENIIL